MQKTEYLELNLPEGDDYYNVEDFNENAQKIDQTIHEMKESFQTGVEACYNACVTKGSTPASYALGDVVQGILNISGGSGEACTIIPQEMLGRNLFPQGYYSYTEYLPLSDSDDLIIAHIIPETDSNINIVLSGDIESSYSGTITFSLLIDNTTTIPNIGSVTVGHLDYDEKQNFTFSYSLTTSLSYEYHTLAIRASFSSGFNGGQVYWTTCYLYGTGFVAANVGGYLVNGEFMNFIPYNFSTPTNPIVYQLITDPGEYGSCVSIEDYEEAMNAHYPSSFDSGNSFHLEGITGYWDSTWDEEDPPEYIIPPIADTLSYGNGKFTYSHTISRSFPVAGYGCDVAVKEEHSFLLPIMGKCFNLFDYINIHGKMIGTTESGVVSIMLLKRTSQSTVDYSDYGYQYELVELSNLSNNEEFTISVSVDDINNNNINFIGIYFYDVSSDEDPFSVEVDKIWGTHEQIEDY